MHGNVAELCRSRGDYWTAPAEVRSATAFVARGGSHLDPAAECRSAARGLPDGPAVGLRVVCEQGKPRTGTDLFFNHEDLVGWEASGHWTVADRVLVGQAGGGAVRLFTHDAYARYTLSFELKVSDDVGFGIRPRQAVAEDAPTGPVLLFPGKAYKDDYGFGAGLRRVVWGSTRELPDHKWVTAPAKQQEIDKVIRSGAFNTVELTVEAAAVTAVVNGYTLPAMRFPADRATGRVSFVLEGTGEARVRNVRFKPLP